MREEMKYFWKKGEVKVECFLDKANKLIIISGPLGSCVQSFEGKDILFSENSVLIKSKASLGYFQSRILSLLKGVSTGYFIELAIVGRGYRFVDLVDRLLVKLGYTHYFEYKNPKGVKLIASRNSLLIFGLDLEEVNRVGGLIRNFMVPESYKGKGIRYAGEEVILKVGKKN